MAYQLVNGVMLSSCRCGMTEQNSWRTVDGDLIVAALIQRPRSFFFWEQAESNSSLAVKGKYDRLRIGVITHRQPLAFGSDKHPRELVTPLYRIIPLYFSIEEKKWRIRARPPLPIRKIFDVPFFFFFIKKNGPFGMDLRLGFDLRVLMDIVLELIAARARREISVLRFLRGKRRRIDWSWTRRWMTTIRSSRCTRRRWRSCSFSVAIRSCWRWRWHPLWKRFLGIGKIGFLNGNWCDGVT